MINFMRFMISPDSQPKREIIKKSDSKKKYSTKAENSSISLSGLRASPFLPTKIKQTVSEQKTFFLMSFCRTSLCLVEQH